MTDHIVEAEKCLAYATGEEALANIDCGVSALAHALLALVEQQRIANRIAAHAAGMGHARMTGLGVD